MRGVNKMIKNVLKIMAICLIGLLVACSNNNTDEDKTESIIPVETITAQEDEIVVNRTLSGRTAPNRTTPVMVEVPGEIEELNVENGDKVEEDEVLATLKTPAGNQDITAPKSGEVAELELDEEDVATDSDPFAVIIDMEKLKINYDVTSNVRSLMEKDMILDTVVDDETYETTITSIGSIPGETGLYPVEGVVENVDDQLIPGLVVKTSVPEKRIKDTIVVPTEAIIEESDGAFVYLVEDNVALKTEITIKESQSDVTAIEGDVKVDDEVVINGQLTLSDGREVEVVEEEENQS